MSDLERLLRNLASHRDDPSLMAHPSFRPYVPHEDADHEHSLELRPGKILHTEGQSFILEYRDTAGHESMRRVSVWAIRIAKDGCPILVAKCHERKATRYFRFDRVIAVMGFDGTVKEPLCDFWKDTFGINYAADRMTRT